MSNESNMDVAVTRFIHHANTQAQMQNMFQGFVRTPVYPVHAELLRELCKTLTTVLADPTSTDEWERLRDFSAFAAHTATKHQASVAEREQEQADAEPKQKATVHAFGESKND